MGIFSWLARKADSTRSPEEPRWLDRWVLLRPGRDDPRLDDMKRAAAEDVAAMEEEDQEYFRRDAPGHIEDDL